MDDWEDETLIVDPHGNRRMVGAGGDGRVVLAPVLRTLSFTGSPRASYTICVSENVVASTASTTAKGTLAPLPLSLPLPPPLGVSPQISVATGGCSLGAVQLVVR
jgi:hypothetical protein